MTNRKTKEHVPSGSKFWTDKKIYNLGETVTIYWKDMPVTIEPGWYNALIASYPMDPPCAKRLLKQGKEPIAYRVAVGLSSGKESFILPVEHCVGEYGVMIFHFYRDESLKSATLGLIYFMVVSEGAPPPPSEVPPKTVKKAIAFISVPLGASVEVIRK